MLNCFRTRWVFFFLFVVAIGVSILIIPRVSAAGEQPPGPDRFIVAPQEFTSYEWWMVNWEDNQVSCTVTIDHPDLPTTNEIQSVCGSTLYTAWVDTEACESVAQDPSTCQGYYWVLSKSEPSERQITITLPPPVVWVTLDGCESYNSTHRCESLPALILTAEEPMTGERITGLEGRINGESFTCDPICQVDLAPTSQEGLFLEFWANSSYGDSSVLFTARIRVASSDVPTDPYWYVDIISSQWRGAPLAGCSQTWNVFPPVGGVPDWLSTPQQSSDLASNFPYEYLAANLIQHGFVDATSCVDKGLLGFNVVSSCGLETARAAVQDWQNQFDDIILTASYESGIPAQLLKNLFSRESQFWPGSTPGHFEAGLGQMTIGGADTTLLWNQPFYEQFCPSVFDTGICRKGYTHLNPNQQESLQLALMKSVNATCPGCLTGIDLAKAETSVATFAEMLLGNCAQAGMVVELNDKIGSGAGVSYEDFWRFSLVNYNAGAGCLGLAVDQTSRAGEPIDWEHVASHLTPTCRGAEDYVNDITGKIP